MTLQDAAKAAGGQSPVLEGTFTGFSIDTRTLERDNLFIALPGNNVDGHDFIEAARQKGAALALVSREVASPLPQIVVQDVVKAMGVLSATWRKQFTLPIVAVTGSNGKTTTKNLLANILIAACDGEVAQVLATTKSFNNHLGVPLTLARLNASHHYAVLEMGMDHFGEIDYLTRLAQPTVTVITNAAAAHLAGVGGDISGVARAKAEIFAGLSQNGIAILNRDDAFFDYWREKVGEHRIISFGFHKEAEVHVTSMQPLALQTPVGTFDIHLSLLGEHNIANAMAATAAAIALSIPPTAIQAGIENTLAASGRLHQHELPNHITLIDDTYNANPYSLQAAIKTLAAFPNQKVLILGDMHSLGEAASHWHGKIGQQAREYGIDYCFTYGNWSKEAAMQFGKGAEHFSTQEALIDAVRALLQPNMTLLIKGSRIMKMEKVVEALLQKAPA